MVVDVARHPTMFKRSNIGPNDGGAPMLERWTIDLSAGKVREERIDERGQEFPRVNETLLGSRLRLRRWVCPTWPAPSTAQTTSSDDFAAGMYQEHDFGRGRTPGEFVFVPSEAATSEDDGWLMGYVYDASVGRSDFVILDAHEFYRRRKLPRSTSPSASPTASTAAGSPTPPESGSKPNLRELRGLAPTWLTPVRLFLGEPGGFGFAHRRGRRAVEERPQLFGDPAEVRGSRATGRCTGGESEVDPLGDHERGAGRSIARATCARTGRSRRSTCGRSPTSIRDQP